MLYYNDDILLYVLVHEICHVLCPNIGHTPEFNNIFEALLEETWSASNTEQGSTAINCLEDGYSADEFDKSSSPTAASW